jgi:hypothetical protein
MRLPNTMQPTVQPIVKSLLNGSEHMEGHTPTESPSGEQRTKAAIETKYSNNKQPTGSAAGELLRRAGGWYVPLAFYAGSPRPIRIVAGRGVEAGGKNIKMRPLDDPDLKPPWENIGE